MKQYKLRNSESTRRPLLVEYTQGGILIRFDIIDVIRDETLMYIYKEFWFDLNEPNIEVIVADNGFELTQEYKDLLASNGTILLPTINWLKADIQSWLTANDIGWLSSMNKSELIALC